MIPITDLIGKGKKQLRMDQVDVAKVAEYAGEDADATWRIEAILAPKVREEGLWDLYADLERPLISVLAGWRRRASRSTSGGCGELSAEFAGRLATHRGRDLQAGRAARSTSTRRRSSAQVLFEELKLPTVQKTPGGEQSTAQEVLEELAAKHPAARPAPDPAPAAREAQEHLSRRPAGPGPSRRRADPRLVQPGRRGDRPAQLERPEPPEHPGADRGGPADPPGVRGRATGLAAADGRLLADRAADPRPLFRRPGPGPGLRATTTTSTGGRGPDLRRRRAGVDDSMRRVAKTVNFGVIYGLSRLRAGRPAGHLPGRGRGVHRRLLPGIRRGRRVHHPDARGGPGARPGRDDPGPPPADHRASRTPPAASATSPSGRRSTP